MRILDQHDFQYYFFLSIFMAVRITSKVQGFTIFEPNFRHFVHVIFDRQKAVREREGERERGWGGRGKEKERQKERENKKRSLSHQSVMYGGAA